MPTATHPTLGVFTTPEIASAAGVAEWQLRAAVRRGFVEAPPKVGPMLLWCAADLERVRAGLTAAGYIGAPTESSTLTASGE